MAGIFGNERDYGIFGRIVGDVVDKRIGDVQDMLQVVDRYATTSTTTTSDHRWPLLPPPDMYGRDGRLNHEYRRDDSELRERLRQLTAERERAQADRAALQRKLDELERQRQDRERNQIIEELAAIRLEQEARARQVRSQPAQAKPKQPKPKQLTAGTGGADRRFDFSDE